MGDIEIRKNNRNYLVSHFSIFVDVLMFYTFFPGDVFFVKNRILSILISLIECDT